jgi:hypothetical protein
VKTSVSVRHVGTEGMQTLALRRRARRPLSISKRSRTELADSEVMSPAADRVTHHAEQCQDGAEDQNNDADRPDNSDFRDETYDEKDYAEDDQGGS